MLLNNNNSNSGTGGEMLDNVIYRRPNKFDPAANKAKTAAMNGNSPARNSWSFTADAPAAAVKDGAAPVQLSPNKEAHYSGTDADAGLFPNGELKSGSRSRLRQRSISNLTAGVKSREHSNSNCNNKQGTISKGVDYIRMNPAVIRPLTALIMTPDELVPGETELQLQQDRSEFGSPDGHSNPESAHSTAEREAAVKNDALLLQQNPPADLYQAINQNKSNDFKIHRIGAHPPPTSAPCTPAGDGEPITLNHALGHRHGSGRGSARHHTGRKSTAGASGSGSSAVRTEWTFLPTTGATPATPTTSDNREICSKPEVFIQNGVCQPTNQPFIAFAAFVSC